MRNIKLLVCLLVYSFVSTTLYSQQTQWDLPENKEFIEASRLFDNKKYAAAQTLFTRIAEQHSNEQVRKDAHFFMAVCAIRLFNSDAQKILSDFIDAYPESPRMFSAYFEMGNYLFREQKYADAISWYEKVDIRNFSNTDVAEFFYKLGYSYYIEKKYPEAKPLFKEVKDAQSLYAENALFYYSYLEYVDKNYTLALPGFEYLADSSSIFARVVPPYICQIYYVYEEYDKLIQYARRVEGIINPQQLPDIYRVLAGAYFKTLQYDKALPYYEKYFDQATSPSKIDYYEIGYLYFRAGQYAKAASFFSRVTEERTDIAQNAFYHLAYCYIQTGEKDKARNAFRAAMEFTDSPRVTEESMFMHAKLIYELSYAPFNEAITAMKAFITKYPTSQYLDEANSLLVQIFLSAKNYRDALSSLESISVLTTDLKMAYQKITYFRGIELFNNNMYQEAVDHFNKSLQHGMYDRMIRAFAVYWQAEAYYRLNQFARARDLFNEFIITPGAFNSEEYKRAHYNIGYTYFEQENYRQAVIWFRKFLDIYTDEQSSFYSDAAIRAGDSYYMLRDFNQAVRFYGRAVASGSFDTQYALFQEAYCQGLLGNQSAKISLLSEFLRRFPDSQYYDDAVFELAESHLRMGNQQRAMDYYEIIMQNFPSSIYIKRVYLQVALIIYNAEKLDESLIMYKRVIEQYPGSQEAETALTMIRNIYRKKNDVNSYFVYVQNLGGYSTIPEAEQDSLSFDVAQELFLKGDCAQALPLLKNYIQQFGDGFFVIPANFYAAECYFEGGYEFDALQNYKFVLHRAPNQFVEPSLVRASSIKLSAKQYDLAIPFLIDLEQKAQRKQNLAYARSNLIEAYSLLQEYERLVSIAQIYLSTEKLEDKDIRWAQLHMAHAYDSLKDTTQALIMYRTLAVQFNTIEGSEARYRIAQYLFDKGQYAESEKEIISFLERSTPHQYWLGRSYLLWAEIFIARKELFQARYTLQNVLEHYKNQEDGIIKRVSELLDFVADIEMQAQQKTEQPVVIPMGENPELFNNE